MELLRVKTSEHCPSHWAELVYANITDVIPYEETKKTRIFWAVLFKKIIQLLPIHYSINYFRIVYSMKTTNELLVFVYWLMYPDDDFVHRQL